MKQPLLRKLFLLLFMFISLNFLLGSMFLSHAQHLVRNREAEVSFPNYLHSSNIEFKLKALGEKRFKVVLEKRAVNPIKVKIYDILGNLIVEGKIGPEDDRERSFDFSHINSQLFVVEVGNSKYNKTKSIYAQPQGKPQPLDAE